MPTEINWERSEYENRVDVAADQIEAFVDAVLGTIDVESARSSPARWEIVCRYFAGSARAARGQGNTPPEGGKRIRAHLAAEFPCTAENGSPDGFFEFMDWLANPESFQPTALRSSLKGLGRHNITEKAMTSGFRELKSTWPLFRAWWSGLWIGLMIGILAGIWFAGSKWIGYAV